MSYKNRLFLKCISVITAMTAGSVTCFSTPTTAHVINQEVLSIQLEQAEEKILVASDLLVEGGQIIIVNGGFAEMEIPIQVVYDGNLQTRDGVPTAAVVAESSDENLMTVHVDTEEILLQEKEHTINLTLKMEEIEVSEEPEVPEVPEIPEETIEPEEPEVPEVPEIPEGTIEPEEPEVPEVPEIPEETVEPEEPETIPKEEDKPAYSLPSVEELKEQEDKEIGIGELPLISVGTGIEEIAEEETPKEEEKLPEEETPKEEEKLPEEETPKEEEKLPEEEPPKEEEKLPEEEPPKEEEKLPEEETSKEEEKLPEEEPPKEEEKIPEEETSKEEEKLPEEEPPKEEDKLPEEEPPKEEETPEEEQEETESEEVKPLSAEIMLTVEDKIYSATILINEDTEETPNGELQYCPSQYHPSGPLEFVNNRENETVLGEFPAMTKYTIAEKAYLLYSGGNIKLLPGETVKVDLSNSDLKEDFTIHSGAGTDYTIAYTDVPKNYNELYPLIINNKGVNLPISYQWGTLLPVVKIHQLTMEKDGLQWKSVETITYSENDDGQIQIVPNKPEAGTYQIEIFWIENEITLYQLKIPFYVQYGSGDQGGIG